MMRKPHTDCFPTPATFTWQGAGKVRSCKGGQSGGWPSLSSATLLPRVPCPFRVLCERAGPLTPVSRRRTIAPSRTGEIPSKNPERGHGCGRSHVRNLTDFFHHKITVHPITDFRSHTRDNND